MRVIQKFELERCKENEGSDTTQGKRMEDFQLFYGYGVLINFSAELCILQRLLEVSLIDIGQTDQALYQVDHCQSKQVPTCILDYLEELD